ncbi:MAG: hypothetical protein MUC82_03350, partial [Cypionkella sp.]|nr:hypothetical protein [Cypionkella sp.]
MLELVDQGRPRKGNISYALGVARHRTHLRERTLFGSCRLLPLVIKCMNQSILRWLYGQAAHDVDTNALDGL